MVPVYLLPRMFSLYRGAVLGLGVLAIPWTLTNRLDFFIFSSFCLFKNKAGIQQLVDTYVNRDIATNFAYTTTCLFVFFQVLKYSIGLRATSTSTEGFPAKPMIFRCSTSHTRLSPRKHSFVYSYLLVGVPVGWKGSVGGMLSADDNPKKSSWLSLKPSGAWHVVNGDDYLGRGHSEDGLRGKLRDYLQSQACTSKRQTTL